MGRWGAAAVVAASLVAGTLLPAVPAAAVHGAVPGDFNGDGYRDAVLPVPGADLGDKERAGAVVVLYGSASGVSASRRVVITKDSPGVPGAAGRQELFGSATATADLNRDGYADLVVTEPYHGPSVTVLWGSRSGLTKGTLLTAPDYVQWYGTDVAAISAGPGAKTQVVVGGDKGTVTFKGPFSSSGAYGSVVQTPREEELVGSVAVGDFDRNGSPDQVDFGFRRSDLTGSEIRVNQSGERVTLEKGNGFIAATGDVNGDGYTDLVVGDPLTPVTPGVDGELGGRVLVYRGSASGIARDAAPEVITQDTAGVPGTSEKQDTFGAGLAVADLNRDGLAEIVVGAPYEAVGSVRRTGMVTVVPGRRTGPLGAGGYSFHQDTPGVPSVNETRDCFGATVSAADVNKDGKPELFIGAACENHYNGAVFMLPGGSGRPTGTGSRVFTLESLGMPQWYEGWTGGNGLFWII
ncbi:FG-GAP-like repeat-containing protein [Streptomyces sp. NPDC093094]|uniref:FG-GAP-like repeat-containing protein n=1 Tax=Streptomyces sp. NPDC093094 TaxID=3366026 RepID=UPI00382122E9